MGVSKLVPPSISLNVTPLVVDGVMFITTPYSTIYAVDARTGKEIWRYDYELPDDFGDLLRYGEPWGCDLRR